MQTCERQEKVVILVMWTPRREAQRGALVQGPPRERGRGELLWVSSRAGNPSRVSDFPKTQGDFLF